MRKKLKHWPNVSVVENTASIPDERFDLCVMANVLHEVTPRECAELLELADRRTEGGAIVILEIFPLLHPERYAVAYESATLLDILIASGLVADSAPIALRGSGSTAYCVIAKRQQPDRGIDQALVQVNVERAWEDIRRRALSAYAAFMPPRDLGNYQRLFSLLTTIASIEAWRAGTWRGLVRS